jgi:hypothetical protein
MLAQDRSGLVPGDGGWSVNSLRVRCVLAPHTKQDAGVVKSLPRLLAILYGVEDARS